MTESARPVARVSEPLGFIPTVSHCKRGKTNTPISLESVRDPQLRTPEKPFAAVQTFRFFAAREDFVRPSVKICEICG